VGARETESRCSLQVGACKTEVVASFESVLNICDVHKLKLAWHPKKKRFFPFMGFLVKSMSLFLLYV
jgi:hypothetical protein